MRIVESNGKGQSGWKSKLEEDMTGMGRGDILGGWNCKSL